MKKILNILLFSFVMFGLIFAFSIDNKTNNVSAKDYIDKHDFKIIEIDEYTKSTSFKMENMLGVDKLTSKGEIFWDENNNKLTLKNVSIFQIEDSLMYDEEAIKEAIVNAIVHRDYNVMGAEIVINIYDDRIEITSPGGMYSGKSIPNVVDSVIESKRRNPIIADLFHRLKLMNRRGSGLANITNKTNELFKDNGNHVFFESNDEFFIVKVQNANYGAKVETKNDTIIDTLSKNETMIVKIMHDNPNITINEMSKELKLSRSTIIRATNKLTKEGIILRIGSNKNGYWKVKDNDL